MLWLYHRGQMPQDAATPGIPGTSDKVDCSGTRVQSKALGQVQDHGEGAEELGMDSVAAYMGVTTTEFYICFHSHQAGEF